MKIFKRFLSMFLAICLLTSVLPMEARAEGTEGTEDIPLLQADAGTAIGHMATKPADGNTAGEPFPENTAGSFSFRIPALVTLSDGTLVAAADARWNTTYDGGGLDTIVARSTDNGANWNYTFANYLGDNGNVYNGSSTCFIDPSLAVTADDTIYMLVDLYPYGVALNGNKKEIDPQRSVGFNDAGQLLLSDDNHGSYGYYLDSGKIYTSAGNEVAGYTVDAHFNIFRNGTYKSNLFFADSPYKVVRTGYLYLTQSTDKGATWSAPRLLNLKTANEWVCLVGPGRGLVTKSGTIIFPVYSYAGENAKYTGLIYSTDNGVSWKRSANLSTSGTDIPNTTSEAAMVELGNGKIRTFFRNDSKTLCYSDFDLTNGTWAACINTGVACNSDTELSAIVYSKQVEHDGKLKDVVLVSCPAGPNAAGTNDNNGAYRSSGKIFAGLIDPTTYEMTWLDKSVAVTPVATGAFGGSTYTAAQGFFAYSCLTEQKGNGSVSILYEDSQQGWGSGDGYGYTMDFKTYTESDLETALGVTFADATTPDVGGGGDEPEEVTINVTLKVGDSYNATINGVALNGSTDTATATVTWTGTEAAKSTTEITSADALVDGKQYLIVNKNTGDILTDNVIAVSGQWKDKTGLQTEGKLSADSAELWVIKPTADNSGFYVMQNGKYLAFAGYYASMVDTPTVLTLTHKTDGWTLYDGTTYAPDGEPLNPDDHDYYLHDGVADNYEGGALGTKKLGEKGYWAIYEVTETIPAQTTVSIVGNKAGTTTAVVGNTTYNITVIANNVTAVQDVVLKVDETQEFADPTGNYETAVHVEPDPQIVTMDVTGTSVEYAKAKLRSDSSEVELSKCLFTFTDDDNDDYFVVESAAVAGRYLNNIMADASTAVPFSATAGKVWIDPGHTEMFQFTFHPVAGSTYGNGTGSAHLHFHTEQQDPYWNRCGGDTSEKCHEYLYRMVKTGETSSTEIPGYVRVTKRSEIVSGESYLIAHTNGTNYYVLYPGTSQNGCVAQVMPNKTTTVGSTTITFEGVSPGTTYAVVGNTQYNITVLSEDRTADIELEVGETFTYTDTTGNYVGTTYTQPDGTYATMAVSGGTLEVRTPVTEIESGKRYLIINKLTGAILTDRATTASGEWGGKPGLQTITEAEMATPELWTIAESNGKYTVTQNDKYLAVAGIEAHMYDTETPLALTYTDQGWTISDDATWKNLNHDEGVYFLSDNVGHNYSGSALGTAVMPNDAMYWDIVEITAAPCTDVSFTGIAPGETTAKVGNTIYNITVVEQETDDEVENTATDIWTVDPEIQEERISAATVENTGYTDETWKAYEEALIAARNKLAEVTSAVYPSEQDAQAALDDLAAQMYTLENAKDALVVGKNITIRYWRLGGIVEEATICVPLDAVTYELPATRTFNGENYTVSPTHLTVAGNAAQFDVHLLQEYNVTSGIVGHADLVAGDLVTRLEGRPVNEMTVTVGVEYNLDLADILTDGQYVEWFSGNEAVATADGNGKVNAMGVGNTTITAVIKNQNGSVAKTYETTITVLPAADDDVLKRTVAMYVDSIDNTTVTCVLYANGEEPRHFDVIEGELIYGKFEKQTGTNTGVDTVTGLTFFGKPDDSHALDYMASSQSSQEYFPLHVDGKVVQDNGDPLGDANDHYYADKTTGAARWLAIGLSGNTGTDINTDIKADVWQSIVDTAQSYADRGYDGAQGFTRRTNEGDAYSNLSFASDPLPKIDKVVDGVLPIGGKFQNYQRYVENMVAAVDEIVFFKITITLDRPLKWEPARNADGTIIKDADGNNVPATDENGNKLSAITFDSATLLDDALEFDPDDGDLEAYFYTKEDDQEDGSWDGVLDKAYQVNTQDITEMLNAGWADDETQRVREFFLAYKIVPEDIPKFNIPNTAHLSYSYYSEYSTGTTAVNAPATASITVIGEAMDNVVIDFGQTIVYTGLTNRHLKGVYVDGTNDDPSITQCKAVANYGTVTVTREPVMENGVHKTDGNGYPEYTYTVTYTPTAILQAPDMVRLYGVGEEGKEKIINGFIVYPATTVYYEEGFAFPAINSPDQAGEWDMTSGSWDLTHAETASVNQTLEKLGKQGKDSQNKDIIVSDKQNPYGFDPVYNTADPDGETEDNNEASDEFKPVYSHDALNGSFAESHTIGDRTRFSFTGNGIQLFAHCTPDSGYVSVEVREATEPYRIVRLAIVNTQMLKGDTDATAGQTGSMDSLPVASLINVQNMPYGQYIVTITKNMDSNPVYIDGIRIFNTVKPNPDNSPFTIDYEDHPSFYELRDAVLYAVGGDTGVEGATEDYIGKVTQQIYDGISGASAVVIDPNVEYANSGTLQDLLDNGPKNELFLYPGQSLTFSVTTDRCMQVGLKAPQGKTTARLTAAYLTGKGEEKTKSSTPTVSSAVDMFYYLADEPAGETVTYTVTIENTGNKILSLTLLKICDDPQAAFAQLTREDIEKVLTAQNAPITIITQPVDAEVKMGERFNVEVTAAGDNLRYQWYYRNAGSSVWQKSGVRDNTYDDVMTKARAGREVYCVITDAAGNSVTTNTVKLIAKSGTTLVILQQPTDASAKIGERYCVEVIATGEDLQYRWYFRNGGTGAFHQSGVTDNTYDDVMTKARAGREVYCVITDSTGNSVTTKTVKLIALPKISLEIVQQPADSAARMGERFCVEVLALGENLKYQWYYRNAGSVEFVASGVRDNTYDDVMTNARAGREVYCVITDGYGNSVTTDLAKLVLIPKETLEILQQPSSAEAKMGQRFCVEVTAKGDGLRYTWYFRNLGSSVWYKSGVVDNTYDDVMTKERAGREVYCVITDACGNQVTTETVRLIAVPEETLEILQQPVDAAAMLGERYCAEVLAKGEGLRYTWYFRNLGSSVWYKSGVTDNTYDDVMTKARAGRQVYCVITDACGNTVTTEIVTLVCIKEPQMVTVN